MKIPGRALFAWIAQRAGWMNPFVHPSNPDAAAQQYFAAGYPTTSGADSMMQVTALQACVRLISGSTAKLPCPVYRRFGEEERKRDRNHAVDQVMNVRFNPWMTAFDGRRTLTAHVALHGNGIALKKRDRTGIVALIPWHPGSVRISQESEDAPPMYELQHRNGGSTRHGVSDILHLRDLSLDGVVGLSRVQQAQQGLRLSMAAEQFGISYFVNGAEVGTAIVFDKPLGEKVREENRKYLQERYAGARRAFGPLIVEGGAKLDRVSSTNKDSQMLELRSFQVEDIARLYGVPPHMIGLTEKQTSYGTGVEHMALGFLQFSLLDWLVMWETAAKRDLFDEVSERPLFIEHIVEGLLRADFKTRMDGYAAAIQNGILSRNECRQKENMAPYAEGDQYLYPSNMAIAGAPQAEVDGEPEAIPARRKAHAWRSGIRGVMRSIQDREVA